MGRPGPMQDNSVRRRFLPIFLNITCYILAFYDAKLIIYFKDLPILPLIVPGGTREANRIAPHCQPTRGSRPLEDEERFIHP